MDEDIRNWLKEDVGTWDISSNLNTRKKSQKIHHARLLAKQDGVICGTDVFSRVFSLLGVSVKFNVEEGDAVYNRDTIANLSGSLDKILQGERVALNILTHMSGIATYTRRIIDLVKLVNPELRISATRKTLPGLRKYQKWAVYIGGGDTHRISLSAMVMLKENHLISFQSIAEAIKLMKEQTSFSAKIEVEVKDEQEALEAAEAGPDIIMLDNFTPQAILSVVPKLRKYPKLLIEASGNISEDNIVDYAITGVDIISMGKLTHSSTSLDLSLLIINE